MPYDFDSIVEQFRRGELQVDQWNFCIGYHNAWGEHEAGYDAYIMGEGAEQCLASKHGFATKKEIKDLYHSLGVKFILPI